MSEGPGRGEGFGERPDDQPVSAEELERRAAYDRVVAEKLEAINGPTPGSEQTSSRELLDDAEVRRQARMEDSRRLFEESVQPSQQPAERGGSPDQSRRPDRFFDEPADDAVERAQSHTPPDSPDEEPDRRRGVLRAIDSAAARINRVTLGAARGAVRGGRVGAEAAREAPGHVVDAATGAAVAAGDHARILAARAAEQARVAAEHGREAAQWLGDHNPTRQTAEPFNDIETSLDEDPEPWTPHDSGTHEIHPPHRPDGYADPAGETPAGAHGGRPTGNFPPARERPEVVAERGVLHRPGERDTVEPAPSAPPPRPPERSVPYPTEGERLTWAQQLDERWMGTMLSEHATIQDRQQLAVDMINEGITTGAFRKAERGENAANPYKVIPISDEGRGLLHAIAAADKGLTDPSAPATAKNWPSWYVAEKDWEGVKPSEYIEAETSRQQSLVEHPLNSVESNNLYRALIQDLKQVGLDLAEEAKRRAHLEKLNEQLVKDGAEKLWPIDDPATPEEILERYQVVYDRAAENHFVIQADVNGRTEDWPILRSESERFIEFYNALKTKQEQKLLRATEAGKEPESTNNSDITFDPSHPTARFPMLNVPDTQQSPDIEDADIVNQTFGPPRTSPHIDTIHGVTVETPQPPYEEPEDDIIDGEVISDILDAPDAPEISEGREVAVMSEYDKTMNELGNHFDDRLQRIRDVMGYSEPDLDRLEVRLDELYEEALQRNFIFEVTDGNGNVISTEPRLHDDRSRGVDYRSQKFLNDEIALRHAIKQAQLETEIIDGEVIDDDAVAEAHAKGADPLTAQVDAPPSDQRAIEATRNHGLSMTELQERYDERLDDIADDALAITSASEADAVLAQIAALRQESLRDGYTRIDPKTQQIAPSIYPDIVIPEEHRGFDRDDASVIDGRSDVFLRDVQALEDSVKRQLPDTEPPVAEAQAPEALPDEPREADAIEASSEPDEDEQSGEPLAEIDDPTDPDQLRAQSESELRYLEQEAKSDSPDWDLIEGEYDAWVERGIENQLATKDEDQLVPIAGEGDYQEPRSAGFVRDMKRVGSLIDAHHEALAADADADTREKRAQNKPKRKKKRKKS